MGGRRRIARIDLVRTMRPIAALAEVAGGPASRCSVQDVSAVGIFVESALLPAPGVPVVVRFGHPNGTPIEVRGRVRWSGSSSRYGTIGFGVEIEAATDSYFDLYQKLLDELGTGGLRWEHA